MQKLLVISIMAVFGFSEITWEREVVDSCGEYWWDFTFNALALDTSNIPHIVYNELNVSHKIIYASRVGSNWQKEVIESGPYLYYYSFSLIFDRENNPHLSYYRRDEAVGKTYVCYARRENTGWQRVAVDSIVGSLGDWCIYIYSSIDLDTSGLPGIAYIAWNVEDSLHYVKYAHYNGTNWDTSIVEYDSAYANTTTLPTDFSPSLKYNSNNIPHIAFYQYYNHYDTIKIAYYDDSLNNWVVEPAINMPVTRPPISLQLHSRDYPCIAHGWGADVAYSWWDGLSWYTESTGTTMGWAGIQIILDLDSLDNPHIVYLPDPTVGHPCYSYKQDNIWHNTGWIEPDTFMITMDVHISFALDKNDEPHVLYPCEWNDRYLKYAKGTFVGINEDTRCKIQDIRCELEVYPNPFSKKTDIIFGIGQRAMGMELKIYDATGRLVKQWDYPTIILSDKTSWYGRDNSSKQLPSGVYFLKFKADNYSTTEKLLLIK
ncbi:T9SS type A sorting domain-containing protein [bacterium]|nr:T9SS type A sorting domain-containing protein [bacterium]